MRLPFYKYQATGNDFVIINQQLIPYLQEPSEELVAKLCHRKFGIGADGLMILEKSNRSDFKMIYYNSDGRTSTMCGNGGRAIVHLAYSLGLFKERCTFEAVDGLHDAEVKTGNIISLKMGNVSKIREHESDFVLDTGSPHYVRLQSEVMSTDIMPLAKEIRYGAPFAEEGINVNFIQQHEDHLDVRTYERGVEDETLSCGTGVTAAALVASREIEDFRDRSEINIVTKGGKLKVRFKKSPVGFEDIWLIGEAQKVFEGNIEL